MLPRQGGEEGGETLSQVLQLEVASALLLSQPPEPDLPMMPKLGWGQLWTVFNINMSPNGSPDQGLLPGLLWTENRPLLLQGYEPGCDPW